MREALSRHRSWRIDRDDEDIRGWTLRDSDGRTLGTVAELIFDSTTEHITDVVLADNEKFPASDVAIGDHVLTLTNGAARARAEARGVAATAATPVTRIAVPARPEPRAAPVAQASSATDIVIPIIEEEIEVAKRQVSAGAASVRTHVVAEPISEELHLRDERVTVERRRVDRPLEGVDVDARFADRSFEMTAKHEEPVVEKHARLVEEIVITKTIDERLDHVRDTLRRTEVEITELPADKKGQQP
ncbi:MAG TPA: PRC and DUF2382 domain-containing protein [Kofleriaceae bacterium]|nr:PRC and DUF2382 domain-containing protein [Kofleriaceae bacterium]